MGFYEQGPDRKPRWYDEFLAVTGAVLSVLMWPIAILFGFIIWLALTFVAFSTHWVLGLLCLAVLAGAIAAFAYWDSHRPPTMTG